MPKKIIIRTPNFIGDTIMMLPALELIRMEYPEAELTVVCRAMAVDVFRGKGISEIIVDDTKGKGRLRRTLKLVKQLRQNSYDLCFLFHNSFLTALLFRLAKVKRLVGYNKEGRKFLLNFSLPIDRSWHYSNHYANLVNQYLGGKYDKLPPMKLETQESKFLNKGEKPLVGFVFGGENKGERRYPRRLSKELVESLCKNDIEFVLLGDNQDCENHKECASVAEKNQKKYYNFTGGTSVAEFIDAIAVLDLLVTIDTSAMHIAAATGTEFIVLVGKGTSPLSVVFPKDGKGHIINKGMHCLKGEDMISAIQPRDIYNKIMEVLKKKSYL